MSSVVVPNVETKLAANGALHTCTQATEEEESESRQREKCLEAQIVSPTRNIINMAHSMCMRTLLFF